MPPATASSQLGAAFDAARSGHVPRRCLGQTSGEMLTPMTFSLGLALYLYDFRPIAIPEPNDTGEGGVRGVMREPWKS